MIGEYSSLREMNMVEITDKELKLQGFIRQKNGDHFVVRVKTRLGTVSSDQMIALSEIARKYGRGYIYLTNRLNIIIPWCYRSISTT
jgi:anaerobic sulfite reductase subunit C